MIENEAFKCEYFGLCITRANEPRAVNYLQYKSHFPFRRKIIIKNEAFKCELPANFNCNLSTTEYVPRNVQSQR